MHLNPVRDLEMVMKMAVAMVYEHAPTYAGKLSIEFADLPYPADARARFRGNVEIGGVEHSDRSVSFDRFTTASAIGLEMALALRGGWLDYDGDLVVTFHRLPKAEPLVVHLENGNLIAFQFGSGGG